MLEEKLPTRFLIYNILKEENNKLNKQKLYNLCYKKIEENFSRNLKNDIIKKIKNVLNEEIKNKNITLQNKKLILVVDNLDKNIENNLVKQLIYKAFSLGSFYSSRDDIYSKCEKIIQDEFSDKTFKFLDKRQFKKALDEEIKNKNIEEDKINKKIFVISVEILINQTKEDESKCEENFIKIINLNGGEAFEQYSINLIKKILEENYEIKDAKNTSGPKDEGIDGIIKIKYKNLNFEEIICTQVKQRKNEQVKLKEVREFLGSFTYKKYDKGIFITNSSFHKEAEQFIRNQKNLDMIDGNKLYKLAEKYEYGIKKEGDKKFLDDQIFNISIKTT